MMLNKEQIRKLKAQAHSLNPVVMIGQHELSEAVHKEIEVALKAHELMKIRISGADKAQRQAMAEAICQHHQAHLIGAIGHIIIIYRKNED